MTTTSVIGEDGMIWAQFYHLRNNSYVEGVGDRQLIFLDGRQKLHTWKAIAEKEGKKRGYDGYAIYRGNRLCSGFCLSLPKAL